VATSQTAAAEWTTFPPPERLDTLCSYADELQSQFRVDVLQDATLAALADHVEPLRDAVCTMARAVIIPGVQALLRRTRAQAQQRPPRRRQAVVRLIMQQRHAVARLLHARPGNPGSPSYVDLTAALDAACVQRRQSPYHLAALTDALRILMVNTDRALTLPDPADMLRVLASTADHALEVLDECTFGGLLAPPLPTRGPARTRLRSRHVVAAGIARWTAAHRPDGRMDWTATAQIMLLYGWPLWTRGDTPETIGERLRKGV
jgi:hypothetical protein